MTIMNNPKMYLHGECKIIERKDGDKNIYLCEGEQPFEDKSTLSDKLDGYSGFYSRNIVIEYYKTLPGKLTSRKFPFSKNIFKIEKTQRYAIAVHITNLKPSPRKKYGSSEVTGFPSPEFTVKLKSAEKLIDVFSMDLPLMYPIVYDLSLFELTDQMKLIPLGTYRKLYLEMQKKTQ